MSRSMHISLAGELKNKLKIYAKSRKMTMTEAIRYSLEKLFEKEELLPEKEAALGAVIFTRFTIPKGYDLRSFWLTLYMLSSNFPRHSSKDVWGEAVYLGIEEKTNRQIFNEIKAHTTEILQEDNAQNSLKDSGLDGVTPALPNK